MRRFTQLNAWAKLQQLAETQLATLTNLGTTGGLSNLLNLTSSSIELDLSHQRINQDVLAELLDLAKERQIEAKIQALVSGEKINLSERRSALHTALRIQNNQAIFVDGLDIVPDLITVREKMRLISDQIRAKAWLGYSGKPISHIVNIGMGGSDFGARFCLNALAQYQSEGLDYHFVSDMDPSSFAKTVAKLNPETTLFIVS